MSFSYRRNKNSGREPIDIVRLSLFKNPGQSLFFFIKRPVDCHHDVISYMTHFGRAAQPGRSVAKVLWAGRPALRTFEVLLIFPHIGSV